ncbi:hypothetical protein ES708_02868 [subsurface metagenome]
MDFQKERIFKGPGFAETLYIGTIDGKRCIRKASNPDARGFSRTALVREIRLLRNLHDDLKPYFPELIRTNLGDRDELSPDLPDVIYYDMPYYSPDDGWGTLSTLLTEGSLERNEATHVIGEILDTAFTYFRFDTREPDPVYTETTMLHAMRDSLRWAASDVEFCGIMEGKNLRISGKRVKNIHEFKELFEDTEQMRRLLTPYRDRFLHGDFFPENILYNKKTGRWILLDPVSVRGVHRGDFVLDINKMGDWLSGELPALRMGLFTVDFAGNNVDFAIHNTAGKLEQLHRLGLFEWYRERLRNNEYADVFSSEPGWEHRYVFVKVFYSLCMLPLAEKSQAIARYFLAIKAMDEWIGMI